jgi:hypothetical protein
MYNGSATKANEGRVGNLTDEPAVDVEASADAGPVHTRDAIAHQDIGEYALHCLEPTLAGVIVKVANTAHLFN